MRWYFVSTMFRANIDSVGATIMQQRRVFVVLAANKDEAFQLGRLAAVAKEHSYVNEAGERIKWEFVSIESAAELFDVDITSGTEVYWAFIDP